MISLRCCKVTHHWLWGIRLPESEFGLPTLAEMMGWEGVMLILRCWLPPGPSISARKWKIFLIRSAVQAAGGDGWQTWPRSAQPWLPQPDTTQTQTWPFHRDGETMNNYKHVLSWISKLLVFFQLTPSSADWTSLMQYEWLCYVCYYILYRRL